MPQFPYYTEPTHDQGAVATATRTTAVSSAENRLIVDAVDKIFLLEPGKHPLTTLLTQVGRTFNGTVYSGSSLRKASAFNPAFDCFEDFYGGRYAKVSGAQTNSDTTIEVTGAGSNSGYIFTVGDLVKNARTGEIMRVTSVAAGSIGTGTRGSFGSTAAAAMADGDGLFIVGNANEENANARNVNSTRTNKQTNYTQIFRTSISVSNTEVAAKLYGGPDLPYQRAKKGTEHAWDIERAFWFGEKTSTTGTNGLPMRMTGGILEFLTSGGSYVQNQNGPLTGPDMNVFLREGFTYNQSASKLLFCGNRVLTSISEISRGQLLTSVGDSSYGVKISEWQTPFGNINIVQHPLFVQDFAGYSFLIDLDCFRYRYMEGRDTKLRTNIQSPDADGEIDEYISEVGLERNRSPLCALLKGVTD